MIKTGGQRGWAAVQPGRFKKWTERLLEQLQLIGSDLEGRKYGSLKQKFQFGSLKPGLQREGISRIREDEDPWAGNPL